MEVKDTKYLELIDPYYYEGHQPTDVVAVVVWVENDVVNVVPNVVRVENAEQTVVWFALNGKIDTIVFHENKDTPGPPAINTSGSRLETRVPEKKHTGPHKYEFTFVTDGGKSIPVDPIAVIEY